MSTQDRHDNSYDFVFSFNDGSIPALNTLLDSQLPVGLQFGGTISQAAFGGAQTLPEFLEKWRSANGHVDITHRAAHKRRCSLEAKGGLDLDDRASCSMASSTLALRGSIRPFASSNIDPGLITAGQFLSGLFGKGGDVPGRLESAGEFLRGLFVDRSAAHVNPNSAPLLRPANGGEELGERVTSRLIRRPKSGAAVSWPCSMMPRRIARVRVKSSKRPSPSPLRIMR